MMISLDKNQIEGPAIAVFLQRLKQIYAAMDRAYDSVANAYGFTCDGCRDNCCRSRFYHYTLIEYAYLMQGLQTLSGEAQNKIRLQAAAAADATAGADDRRGAPRPMCPLNFDARCILYAYRPMICRLHGIPHELKKPGQPLIRRAGCDTFNRRCGSKDYLTFDRTPFYREMAKLAQEINRSLGFAGKFRMTVAEMIVSRP